MRENLPTDREALRIVPCDSWRRLEGWTILNYGFDEFRGYKYRQRLALPRGTDDLFVTAEEEAKEFASRWAIEGRGDRYQPIRASRISAPPR